MSTEDWSGETGLSTQQEQPSEHVVLPVGIKKDGQIYKEVVIEEMSGIDDHNIASKAANNGATAVSYLLCRCIQEVPGLLPRKPNPEKLFDLAMARSMCVSDRDYLVSRIYMLSGRNESMFSGKCPLCNELYEEQVLLTELPVIEWPEDKPWELDFELEVGSPEKTDSGEVFHREGILRFPTGKDVEYIAKIKNPAQMVDAMLATLIRRLGTLETIDQERVKRFKSRDRRYLMEDVIQREMPGFRQWKDVECMCGREFTVKIDLTAFLGGRRKSTKK